DACERGGALRLEVLDLGQGERQLGVRDRDDATVVAVDDRDRAAPVALAREAPVAQAEADRRLGPAPLGQPLDDRAAALWRRQAAELLGVDEPLVGRVRRERPLLGRPAALGGLD